MSVPCVRIELTYADGSYQVAEGDAAEVIRRWLDFCQDKAAQQLHYGGPQLEFHQAACSEENANG
jgi:hypothetical protein